MRVTHALLTPPLPADVTLKTDDKRGAKIDTDLFRRQMDGLRSTLHEAGVHIVDLQTPSITGGGLCVGDEAVVIRGVALLTRPKREYGIERRKELARILSGLSWTVLDTPEMEEKRKVILDGADILYTGREIFVGVRKSGTNMEGAMVLGRAFPDLVVTPISMSDKTHPLNYYVSMASETVISIGTSKEAANILKKLERDAAFRYRTITVDEEAAVGCLFFNERIVFRSDMATPKFNVLQSAGMQLWALDVSELAKIGAPFGRFCLLVDVNGGTFPRLSSSLSLQRTSTLLSNGHGAQSPVSPMSDTKPAMTSVRSSLNEKNTVAPAVKNGTVVAEVYCEPAEFKGPTTTLAASAKTTAVSKGPTTNGSNGVHPRDGSGPVVSTPTRNGRTTV